MLQLATFQEKNLCHPAGNLLAWEGCRHELNLFGSVWFCKVGGTTRSAGRLPIPVLCR